MSAVIAETAPANPVTINIILDKYVSEGMDELQPRTAKDYLWHIKRLREWYGDRIAAELKPRDFATFLQVKRGKTNRVRSLAVLSAALTQAVRRYYILDVNVLRDVERPKSKPRDRLIADEEFQSLRQVAPPRMRLALDLALLTGQRQGDIIRFKWTDIHAEVIDGKRVSFLHVQQGKTGKRLGIEITPDLKKVLGKCWMLEGGGKNGSEYILPTRFGRPYTPDGFRAGWQRVHRKWKALGKVPLHFHDTRALAATKCDTLEAAQALLGHTSPAMTRRVYRRGVERVRPLSMSVVERGA